MSLVVACQRAAAASEAVHLLQDCLIECNTLQDELQAIPVFDVTLMSACIYVCALRFTAPSACCLTPSQPVI
eukprot:1838976-Amphidinium_carterae.1